MKVFISHRSLDAAVARALAACVDSVGGSVYLDERDPELDGIIIARDRERTVMGAIRSGLEQADVLAAVITRRTRGSWWVPAEISAAQQMGKQIALVCEPGVRPPDFDIDTIIDGSEALRHWFVACLGQDPKPSCLTEVENLLFRSRGDDVRNASVRALEDIFRLWDPEGWTDLELEEPRYAHQRRWMGARSRRLIDTLYSIAAPVFLFKRAAPLLDRSEVEREVANILYEAWTDEESLARVPPAILYEARKCTNWRSLRDQDPRRYWLQGMKPKDLDALFGEMTTPEGALIARETFVNLYLQRYTEDAGRQKPLGLAANALQGFTLADRPVHARVLAVHARVHSALLRLDDYGGVLSTSLEDLFGLPGDSAIEASEEGAASLAYLQAKFAARLEEFGRR